MADKPVDNPHAHTIRTAPPTWYAFFVSGHLMVHPPLSAKLERYTTPFEVVVTLQNPVTDNEGLERLRRKVETEARRQLTEAAPNHLMAECMIRNLSLLHTITE